MSIANTPQPSRHRLRPDANATSRRQSAGRHL